MGDNTFTRPRGVTLPYLATAIIVAAALWVSKNGHPAALAVAAGIVLGTALGLHSALRIGRDGSRR